jgi:MATE family multidrug resistance protein
MRDMMLLSLAIFLLCWAVLAPLLGNSGLWIAFLVFLAIRGCTLGWRLRFRMRD